MTVDDVEATTALWEDAFEDLRVRSNLPGGPPTPPGVRDWMRARARHQLATDADGSWVALVDGNIVGLTAALVRDGLWVLSQLAVSPAAQDRGLGRRLLELALDYGGRQLPGLIMCSRDPRANRRYIQAGFEAHPAMTAMGPLRRGGLPAVSGVRDAGVDGLELAAHVDRVVRGASHGADHTWLVSMGDAVRTLDDSRGRGYALVEEARLHMLAATEPAAARALLVDALARMPDGTELDIGWLTGGQQWAFPVLLSAGAQLQPSGPLMVRGGPGPLSPWIPHGAFG
jgi:GNAT superfamily N-acetyltransferase